MTLQRQLLAVGIVGMVGFGSWAQQPLTRLWSVDLERHAVMYAAVSPDGTVVATGGVGPEVKLHNAVDGTSKGTLTGHSSRIVALQFSRDGSLLGSISRDEQMKFWSMTNGAEVLSVSNMVFGGSANESALAFGPGDSLVVTPLKHLTNNLGIWSFNKQTLDLELLHQLRGHGSELHAAEFSPDGTMLATAGGFRAQDLTVKVWNAATGVLLKTLQTSNTYGVDALAFSPDGKLLATGTDDLSNWAGRVELWNTDDWTLKHRLDGKGFLLEFSPDGEFLLAARDRKMIDLWRTDTGTLVRRDTLPFDGVASLATLNFLPDGNTVVLGGFFLSDGVQHGRLAAVRFPGREIEARRRASGLELQWNSAEATLEGSADLTTGWMDVTATNGATLPLDGVAGFFRLKFRSQ